MGQWDYAIVNQRDRYQTQAYKINVYSKARNNGRYNYGNRFLIAILISVMLNYLTTRDRRTRVDTHRCFSLSTGGS